VRRSVFKYLLAIWRVIEGLTLVQREEHKRYNNGAAYVGICGIGADSFKDGLLLSLGSESCQSVCGQTHCKYRL
jgi:hypothetical protein